MSQQQSQWRCEADALADLQAMSSSHASAAAARESVKRGEKRAPVRLQTSVGRGTRAEQTGYEFEADPWGDGSLSTSTSPDRSPQGVKFASSGSLPMGRAKMIAKYIKEAKFDHAIKDLQREIRECGVNGEYNNQSIRYNHQRCLRQMQVLPPVVTLSDSDDDSYSSWVSAPKSTTLSCESSDDMGSPKDSLTKAASYLPHDLVSDRIEFPNL